MYCMLSKNNRQVFINLFTSLAETIRSKIAKFLPKSKSAEYIEVLPMVGHLNSSVTVTRMSISSCIYLTS